MLSSSVTFTVTRLWGEKRRKKAGIQSNTHYSSGVEQFNYEDAMIFWKHKKKSQVKSKELLLSLCSVVVCASAGADCTWHSLSEALPPEFDGPACVLSINQATIHPYTSMDVDVHRSGHLDAPFSLPCISGLHPASESITLHFTLSPLFSCLCDLSLASASFQLCFIERRPTYSRILATCAFFFFSFFRRWVQLHHILLLHTSSSPGVVVAQSIDWWVFSSSSFTP